MSAYPHSNHNPNLNSHPSEHPNETPSNIHTVESKIIESQPIYKWEYYPIGNQESNIRPQSAIVEKNVQQLPRAYVYEAMSYEEALRRQDKMDALLSSRYQDGQTPGDSVDPTLVGTKPGIIEKKEDEEKDHKYNREKEKQKQNHYKNDSAIKPIVQADADNMQNNQNKQNKDNKKAELKKTGSRRKDEGLSWWVKAIIVLSIIIVITALICWGIFTYKRNKRREENARVRKEKKYPPPVLKQVLTVVSNAYNNVGQLYEREGKSVFRAPTDAEIKELFKGNIRKEIIVPKGERKDCSKNQLLVNGNCLSCSEGSEWAGLTCVPSKQKPKHLKSRFH